MLFFSNHVDFTFPIFDETKLPITARRIYTLGIAGESPQLRRGLVTESPTVYGNAQRISLPHIMGHHRIISTLFTRHYSCSSSKAMVLARNRPITNFAPCSINLRRVCMNPSPVVKRSSSNKTHLSLIYSG